MPSRTVDRKGQRSSAESDLGQLKHIYRRSLALPVLGVAIIAICLFGIVSVCYQTINALIHPEKVSLPFPLWRIGLLLFLALLLLIFVSWGTLKALQSRRWCLLLYERGIIEEKQQGSLVLRWEAIEYLRHSKIYTQNAFSADQYEIEGYNKQKIGFTSNFDDHAMLFNRVTERTLPYLLARCREKYLARQEVHFGALIVSSTGIKTRQNDQALPWHEIAAVKVLPTGNVTIKQKGRVNTWFHGIIPNTELFQRLVQEILAEQHTTP